ncbi:T9SS type A sorting domain-containing protein [Bacteroidales bacterium OttesenSCG-928-M06]|nr:T9SS type A sorting domain-containing protein [Bacteroidales bacterium OttesenSCG-928-M06]
MKNYYFILFFLLFGALNLFAQNKITVKALVNQADALVLDAKGEPASVGDESKFEVKGGTSPYSDYTWEQSSEAGKTHKVTIKDANNCSVSIYVNVGDGTDIPTLEEEQRNAYPNPAVNIVNIPMPTGEKNAVILIINTEGLVLYKNTVKITESTYPLTLDSCPVGRYFIQVIGEETKTYSIIKK